MRGDIPAGTRRVLVAALVVSLAAAAAADADRDRDGGRADRSTSRSPRCAMSCPTGRVPRCASRWPGRPAWTTWRPRYRASCCDMWSSPWWPRSTAARIASQPPDLPAVLLSTRLHAPGARPDCHAGGECPRRRTPAGPPRAGAQGSLRGRRPAPGPAQRGTSSPGLQRARDRLSHALAAAGRRPSPPPSARPSSLRRRIAAEAAAIAVSAVCAGPARQAEGSSARPRHRRSAPGRRD